MIKTSNEIAIRVRSVLCAYDRIFVCPEEYNQLYSIEPYDGTTHALGKIPWERENAERLVEKMVKIGSRIYLIPFNAEYLSAYDVETEEFYRIDIRNREGERVDGVFSDAFTDGAELFLIPGSAKTIVKINTDTGRVDYFDDWLCEAQKLIFDTSDGFFRSCGIKEDNCFITPFCNANAILVFNYKEMKYRIVELGTENNGYSGIVRCGDNYWLSPRRGDMYALQCDNDFNQIRRINIENSSFFSGIEINGNKPVIFSYRLMKNSYEEISFVPNVEMLSVDGEYSAYVDTLSLKLSIVDRKHTIYESEVLIPKSNPEIVGVGRCLGNKDMSRETKFNCLGLYIDSILDSGWT